MTSSGRVGRGGGCAIVGAAPTVGGIDGVAVKVGDSIGVWVTLGRMVADTVTVGGAVPADVGRRRVAVGRGVGVGRAVGVLRVAAERVGLGSGYAASGVSLG